MKIPFFYQNISKTIIWSLTIIMTATLFFFMANDLSKIAFSENKENKSLLNNYYINSKEVGRFYKKDKDFLFLINGCIKNELPLRLCQGVYYIKKENKNESALSVFKFLFLENQ
jgi:hypothetical protein